MESVEILLDAGASNWRKELAPARSRADAVDDYDWCEFCGEPYHKVRLGCSRCRQGMAKLLMSPELERMSSGFKAAYGIDGEKAFPCSHGWFEPTFKDILYPPPQSPTVEDIFPSRPSDCVTEKRVGRLGEKKPEKKKTPLRPQYRFVCPDWYGGTCDPEMLSFGSPWGGGKSTYGPFPNTAKLLIPRTGNLIIVPGTGKMITVRHKAGSCCPEATNLDDKKTLTYIDTFKYKHGCGIAVKAEEGADAVPADEGVESLPIKREIEEILDRLSPGWREVEWRPKRCSHLNGAVQWRSYDEKDKTGEIHERWGRPVRQPEYAEVRCDFCEPALVYDFAKFPSQGTLDENVKVVPQGFPWRRTRVGTSGWQDDVGDAAPASPIHKRQQTEQLTSELTAKDGFRNFAGPEETREARRLLSVASERYGEFGFGFSELLEFQRLVEKAEKEEYRQGIREIIRANHSPVIPHADVYGKDVPVSEIEGTPNVFRQCTKSGGEVKRIARAWFNGPLDWARDAPDVPPEQRWFPGLLKWVKGEWAEQRQARDFFVNAHWYGGLVKEYWDRDILAKEHSFHLVMPIDCERSDDRGRRLQALTTILAMPEFEMEMRDIGFLTLFLNAPMVNNPQDPSGAPYTGAPVDDAVWRYNLGQSRPLSRSAVASRIAWQTGRVAVPVRAVRRPLSWGLPRGSWRSGEWERVGWETRCENCRYVAQDLRNGFCKFCLKGMRKLARRGVEKPSRCEIKNPYLRAARPSPYYKKLLDRIERVWSDLAEKPKAEVAIFLGMTGPDPLQLFSFPVTSSLLPL